MDRSELARRTRRALHLGYKVRRDGHVVSPSGRIIRCTPSGGYLKFTVRGWTGDQSRVVFVHQLAALQKFGTRALRQDVQVRHLNDRRSDNRLSNIAIGSASENQLDVPLRRRIENTAPARAAAAIKNRRFTDQEIKQIRASKKSTCTLAKELRVAKSTLSYIRNRKTYAHV